MVLPFVSTFNEFLTRIVESTSLFRFIEKIIVPYEVMLTRTIVSFFGVETQPGTVAIVRNGVQYGTYVVWNCIGWQSILFFGITAFIGLQGDKYTNLSKFKALVIGALGTFWINILRIVFVIFVAYNFGQLSAPGRGGTYPNRGGFATGD